MMKTTSLMVAITSLLLLLQPHPAPGSPLTSLERIMRRGGDAKDDRVILDECVQMKSAPGQYLYTSPGRHDVCGLFIVGAANQIVTIEFEDFEIDCDDGGLFVLIDGWEIDEQLFPNPNDHPLTIAERYHVFCGADRPPRHHTFIMSQNVAMLQFRIPQFRQYFHIRLNYHHNPAPCNVMWTESDGELTLSNHGLRRNCTTLFVYPEVVDVVQLDVGQLTAPRVRSVALSTSSSESQHQRHQHQFNACIPGGHDYLEILGGSGLDTTYMSRFLSLCGIHNAKHDSKNSMSDEPVKVSYPYTAIRLVSSGWSYNTVTVRVSPLQLVADVSSSGQQQDSVEYDV